MKILPLAVGRGVITRDRSDRLATALEAALDAAALLFAPVLAMASLGTAALAVFAGICGAGVAVARRAPLRPLLVPALLLGGLVLWGAVSASWSIRPLRSLDVAARLAGLYVGALALIAAAAVLAKPRRLLLCALAGGALAVILAFADIASGGSISGLLYRRPFLPAGLNRIAVGFAIVLPAAIGTALCLHRKAAGAIAAAMVVTIYALAATIAKLIAPVSIIAAGFVFGGSRAAARVAALASVALILTAPVTFPRLAGLPGMLARAEAVKDSVSHRLEIWSFVGQRIAERPLLGWGLDASRAIPGGKELIQPGETWLPLHPHNAALQVWLELGLPGAVLMALSAAWLWWRVAASNYPRLFAAGAAGTLLGAMIAACGSYDFWHEWWVGTLSLIGFLVCVMGRVCRDAASPPLPR